MVSFPAGVPEEPEKKQYLLTMLHFMKMLQLVFIGGISCFASARLLTPQECERLINQDPFWLMDFYLHANALQEVYLQPDTYGILAPDDTVDFVYQHTVIARYPYPSNLPMKVFFGYGLKHIDGLTERNTVEGTHLHCVSICAGPYLSIDICCACDGKEKKGKNGNKDLMKSVLQDIDSITNTFYNYRLKSE